MMDFKRSKYSRKLPHFDVGQAYYHIVFRLREGFLNETEIKVLKEYIRDNDVGLYKLIAVQVMGNHVHILLQPLESITLSEILRRIKGGSARVINILRNKNGSIWSDKYFDRVIRNQDDLNRTLEYLLYNPVKAGMADDGFRHYGWDFIQE